MESFDFEPFRRPDRSIDLCGAFCKMTGCDPQEQVPVFLRNGFQYLRDVENMRFIKSRQVAAAALQIARRL